jgi:hypothetical protein
MQRYTIIHPLLFSFYSKSLYQDVARNWKGLCLLYLLSVVALCAIPGVMKFHSDLSAYMTTEAPKIAKQVPVITITKGKVSIDKPEPYIINDEKTNAPLIIIDTSGKITSLEGSSAIALIKKTEILVKKDAGETRRFDLSGVDDLVINRSVVYSWIDTIEELFVFILYPIAVLFSFLYHMIEVLLFAVIGIMFTRKFRIPLNFRTLVRLAAISATPSLILGTLLIAADIRVSYWWPMSFWISIGYLYFAVRVNRETDGPVTT